MVEPPPPSESTSELAPRVWVRHADLQYTFARGSGPGGQAVNKVNTAAMLRVAVEAIQGLDESALRRLRRLAGQRLTRQDEIVIHAQEHRSQYGNRRARLARLRELVEEARKVPKVRRKRGPTRAMIRRRLERKRQQSEKKQRRRWKREE